MIFYRKPLHTEVSTSATKNGTSGTKNGTSWKLGPKAKTDKLLKILKSIDSGKFSIDQFVKNHKVPRRTLLRNLKLLKEEGLIFTEGSTSAIKYKVTEKYKKLKKSLLKI